MLCRRSRPTSSRGSSAGELAFAWTTIAGKPRLVVGGRPSGGGPAFYFVHDVKAHRGCARAAPAGAHRRHAGPHPPRACSSRGSIARGVLAPVEAAGRAAERIERGDLSARVPVTSNDEFGTWAERFNRMAEALGRHDRAAGGRRGPEPALRRRCRPRAANAAGGAGRRGVDPARAPRRAAAREPACRRAAGRATWAGSGRSSTT